MAAVLHDVVEDGGVSLAQLRALGYPEPVVIAVDALTKRDDEHGPEHYLRFVERAGQDDIARAVKLADIADNMDISRIAIPTDKDFARMARYRQAKELLETMGNRVRQAKLPEAKERERAIAELPAPVILPLRDAISADEVEQACPGTEPIVACDFYVGGAEKGIGVPSGFRMGRILNVDHHAPVARMQWPITSTILACQYLAAPDEKRTTARPAVVINHTDCDSVLSSALIMGTLEPDERLVPASIAADHSGDANPIADLLQGLDEGRTGDRTAEQYVESLHALLILLEGRRLPRAAQRALDRRCARRRRAARLIRRGRITLAGPLAWAILDEEMDSAFFPALIPDATLIILALRHPSLPDRWVVKLRLGVAAPPGFTLHSLGIQQWNPGFGGRWNAGSNKRGGGTTVEPRDYANRLLAKLIPALMP